MRSLATSITEPSGDKLFYGYNSAVYCTSSKPGPLDPICLSHATVYRLSAVSNNYGYRVVLNYADDLAPNPDESPPQLDEWLRQTGATITNLATSSSPTPTLSVNVTASGGNSYTAFTDALSRVTTYRRSSAGLAGIKLPGSSSEDVTIGYTSGRVSSVTTAAGTITYGAPVDASGIRTVTVTDALSHTTTYTFDIASQLMKTLTDAVGHTTTWFYDASGRVTDIAYHEGNYVHYTYDARGNVTQTDRVAKPGSGVATITTSATFDATCTNPATCNQPNTTVDAKGNVTDYTYDTTYGDLLTATAPAPSSGAVRPQTRYSYSSLQAYYDTGSGIVASGQPVRRLTSVSTCQATASCAGTADEVKTTITYGPQTTGVGNNLLAASISKGDGTGTLTATNSASYDAVGNVTSVDGPLSGTADTTTYRYDAARQRVGVISPDPDGGGALKRRAQRATYNLHGIPTVTETGTVNGTSDSDWTAFASMQQLTTTLDAADRKVKDVLTAGGTTYQVTQYGYDAAGRLDCTALRMNSATWGSLPSSACTLAATGSAGPDRITKTNYDNANRPTLVQTAYGTGDQADEATATYTNNGKTATLTDGQGNKTSYEYDGLDRLVKTRYPDITAGAGTSSTTDYEQLVYDANSNITSRRLRGYAADSAKHIDFTYDNLDRVTLKDLPEANSDLSYAYNLFGLPTSVTVPGQGIAHSLAYDALGRVTSEGQPFGSMSYQYDLAGNRTVQVWNDGFYVTYDHLVTGEVTAIRENGAASGIGVLATYGYDDLGRRTGITRGNGTTTSYGYDAASRLASLGQDLAGMGYDLSLGFSYNSAGQITGTTRSNDVYAYSASTNINRPYTVNGLNQFAMIDGSAIGYDVRGNLTSAGITNFTYDSQNTLKDMTGVAALYYDAFGRLSEYDTSVSTRFLYDGSHMAAEIANPSGAVTRRYVFGPGADEPIVWYEGSGTSDRRWLHADERGSIVAITDASGAAIGINRYDEYGVPVNGSMGLFQYTGQAFFKERGLYYYKARFYAPRIGRFMQTDPIGYGGGMNWYNYVSGDPVNSIDPGGKMEWGCADGRYARGGGGCDPNTPEGEHWAQLVAAGFIDDIVVTAHANNSFDGLHPLRYDLSNVEWIQFGYFDGSSSDANVSEQSIKCNGKSHTANRATSAPLGKLAWLAHGHQDLSTGKVASPPPPGNGDGFMVAKNGIVSYVFSSTDVYAIRPDSVSGVGRIDHLVGNTPYPKGDEAALRANALLTMQQKNSGQKPTVCQ